MAHSSDAKTGQAIFGGSHGVGLRNVGSYRVSGHPFVTGSTTLGQNEVQMIEFPYVSKSFTVINRETANNYEIRVHFQSGSSVSAITLPGEEGTATINAADDVLTGLHFVTVDEGASVTFDVKCAKFYVSQAANASDFSYQVFAELTNIPTGRMYHLTGSGITETGGA